jgi:hypothetical protein
MKTDDSLNRLFAAARADAPGTAGLELGFEARLLSRIREERAVSWFSWAWRMCPYFAALALAVGAWGYFHSESLPDTESVAATLKEGGLTAISYYLGADE